MWPSDLIRHAELDWVIDPATSRSTADITGERDISPFLTWHPQTWVAHPDGTGTLVDIGIAPTITALWVAGVDTAYSCEGACNAWRYVSVRTAHRFVAADVLVDLGEQMVDDRGDERRWFFQLSGSPLSLGP